MVLPDILQDARLVFVEGTLQEDVAGEVTAPPDNGLYMIGWLVG